jgi:hypothetical protein
MLTRLGGLIGGARKNLLKLRKRRIVVQKVY